MVAHARPGQRLPRPGRRPTGSTLGPARASPDRRRRLRRLHGRLGPRPAAPAGRWSPAPARRSLDPERAARADGRASGSTVARVRAGRSPRGWSSRLERTGAVARLLRLIAVGSDLVHAGLHERLRGWPGRLAGGQLATGRPRRPSTAPASTATCPTPAAGAGAASAGRSPARGSTCSTRGCSPLPVGRRRASCTSAAPAWRAGYLDRPGADGRAVRARPVRGRAGRAAVPHRRPGPLAARRRRSSSSAGSTTR